MLQFGLDWFGWEDKNRKPNQTMQLSKNMIPIHMNQMRFFVVSVCLVYGFSIGLVRF